MRARIIPRIIDEFSWERVVVKVHGAYVVLLETFADNESSLQR